MRRLISCAMCVGAFSVFHCLMLAQTSSREARIQLVANNQVIGTNDQSPVNIVHLASGTNTKVFRFDGRFLGSAQNVCLNESNPSNCPAGATLYGLEAPGWLADRSDIPTATWIYAPGITGLTSPAEFNIYFFETVFNVPGTPTGGTLFIAADDSAQVLVNGFNLGTIGSATNFSRALNAANDIHAVDIGPVLVSGTNYVRIRLKNGKPHSEAAESPTITLVILRV